MGFRSNPANNLPGAGDGIPAAPAQLPDSLSTKQIGSQFHLIFNAAGAQETGPKAPSVGLETVLSIEGAGYFDWLALARDTGSDATSVGWKITIDGVQVTSVAAETVGISLTSTALMPLIGWINDGEASNNDIPIIPERVYFKESFLLETRNTAAALNAYHRYSLYA